LYKRKSDRYISTYLYYIIKMSVMARLKQDKWEVIEGDRHMTVWGKGNSGKGLVLVHDYMDTGKYYVSMDNVNRTIRQKKCATKAEAVKVISKWKKQY
jgi:hypothetical protein